jgi:hypothetical protein
MTLNCANNEGTAAHATRPATISDEEKRCDISTSRQERPVCKKRTRRVRLAGYTAERLALALIATPGNYLIDSQSYATNLATS